MGGFARPLRSDPRGSEGPPSDPSAAGAPGLAGGALAWRVIASALFLPAFVWVTRRGGAPFLVFVEVIVALGAREALALGARLGLRGRAAIVYPAALLLPIAAARGGVLALLVIAAAAGAALFECVAAPARRPAAPALAGVLIPLVYPGLFAAFLWELRHGGGSSGAGAIFLLFLVTWSCDTFAYFGGRAFGRRPLAPSVSPKKTWEGAIVGFVAACAAGAAGGPALVMDLSRAEGLLVGALLGVAGQLGDLAESLLKREAGVKDSSRTIPGHGGILDRFDSILVNAPLLYALLLVL